MNEKSDMWERQAALLESSSEATSKLSRLQREVGPLCYAILYEY